MTEPENLPKAAYVDVPSHQRNTAALLAWLLPGAGHLYLGRRFKGISYALIVSLLYLAGLVMSRGEAVALHEEDGHRYAFLAQVGVGSLSAGAAIYTHWPELKSGFDSELSLSLANDRRFVRDRDPAHIATLPWIDTGLLYTMVAGLLNVLIIFEAWTGGQGVLREDQEDGASSSPKTGPKTEA